MGERILALFFSVVLAIAFLPFISAAITCANANQFMFGISNQENAHVSEGDWNIDVCYEDYFENNYNGGNDGNSLIRGFVDGSGFITGHAEGPEENTASYGNISFGDLICELRGAGGDNVCQDFSGIGNRGSRILFLSSTTNAHVALGGFENNYQYELCCVSLREQAICNYNSVCDGNENKQNCEDCDSGGNGDGGGDDEEPPTEGGFCASESEGGYAPFYWLDGGTESLIGACADYNLLVINPRWNDAAWEFKEQACNLDCENAVVNEDIPATATNPRCAWAPANISGRCALSYDISGISCRQEVINDTQCVAGSSTKTVTVRITNTAGGDVGECNPPCTSLGGDSVECQIEVPCPEVLQLPFFGAWNALISFFIIGIIYLINLIKKR